MCGMGDAGWGMRDCLANFFPYHFTPYHFILYHFTLYHFTLYHLNFTLN